LRFAVVEDPEPPPKRVRGEIVAEDRNPIVVCAVYDPAYDAALLAADADNTDIIRVE
jgi:hypothetical protein